MNDTMKDYNKLMQQVEHNNQMILDALDPEAEEDDDEELPPDYVYKPVNVTPADPVPVERKRRVGLLIFCIICAIMCFLYALIFDKAYNEFHPIPVIIGGLFIILGVAIF